MVPNINLISRHPERMLKLDLPMAPSRMDSFGSLLTEVATAENAISVGRIPRLFNIKGRHTGHFHDMVSLLEVVGYNSILSGAVLCALLVPLSQRRH